MIFFPRRLIRDIPPGESRTCTYDFLVLETTTLAQVSRWTAFPAIFPVSLDDPNDENNVADVLLLFAEPVATVSVPALSAWSLLILVLIFGSIGVGALGRRP